MLILLPVALFPACRNKDFNQKNGTAVKIEKRTEGPVSVLFAGDTMLDDLALPYIYKYGYGYPLEKMKPLFLEADIVNINLESPVANNCKREKKAFAYYMLSQGLEAIKKSGVNIVNLANNHILDCGIAGLKETLDNADRIGINHYGAGFGVARHKGLVVKIDGIKIGFLGYYNYGPELKTGGPAHISEKALARDMALMRPEVDVLIATFHWGKNYKAQITHKQNFYGKAAIKNGADAVIGHHPHIIQAMSMVDGKPVVYSVGNLAFGTGNNRAREALAIKLIIEKGAPISLEAIPLFTQNRHPDILWRPKPATGQRAKRTLTRFVKESEKLGANLVIKGEKAVLDLN